MARLSLFALLGLLAVSSIVRAERITALSPALMLRAEDYTHMWWADGFPSRLPSAPWLRVIQTGSYTLAMNTETLRIPHFGALANGIDYVPSAIGDNRDWENLPSAELTLSITVDGKQYRCISGGKWSRYGGPRLIDSGRFLQRADVTNLVFKATDGQQLDVEARFEIAAWPDRLGLILAARPTGDSTWNNAAMEISLSTKNGTLRQRWELDQAKTWSRKNWHQVSISLDPVAFSKHGNSSEVKVIASEIPGNNSRPVLFDPAIGWHRVNLDGINPIVPPNDKAPSNDALERIAFKLSNPTDREQIARLMFEKTSRGIRQRMGSSITGISAILRDADGYPTGIPVQLSKNWHTDPEGGVYAGQWFHGISQVRLPANTAIELELTIAYGHWGGVPAASHAQLSLIGWGSNQHWSQAALGAWGESICFEPDQVQGRSTITDVRPLMVNAGKHDKQWRWTSNVGGGDFSRLFDKEERRVPHSAMRTTYRRHGPCLSEVSFSGRVGDGILHSNTVSLARTDDIVRGTYRIRMDVKKATDFSRFVIFQIGADTYNESSDRQFAIGNEAGPFKEWKAQWGGNTYRTDPIECTNRLTWVSLHDAVGRESAIKGAWANRGIIIRSWKAQLGGKDAKPWIAERGVTLHRRDSSTIDILPPPGITRLEAGDFVEAVIEHIVMPQAAKEYYGPNALLRAALAKNENTWKMINREAVGNNRTVKVSHGTLERRYPDVQIKTDADLATLTLKGGVGYIPITFTGLTSNRGYALTVDGKPVDQSVHGNDYWQTDYDPATRSWSRTYNLPAGSNAIQSIHFFRKP